MRDHNLWWMRRETMMMKGNGPKQKRKNEKLKMRFEDIAEKLFDVADDRKRHERERSFLVAQRKPGGEGCIDVVLTKLWLPGWKQRGSEEGKEKGCRREEAWEDELQLQEGNWEDVVLSAKCRQWMTVLRRKIGGVATQSHCGLALRLICQL